MTAQEPEVQILKVVPYQKCPKCDAQGEVSKPPYIPGDVYEWLSTSGTHLCDVCNGAKIIPMHIVEDEVKSSIEQNH